MNVATVLRPLAALAVILTTAPASASCRPPEREDLLSWTLLSQVAPVPVNKRLIPRFPDAVLALDQKGVKVSGFMAPVEPGAEHSYFLLSAIAPDCALSFHGGGASRMMEIRMLLPLRFTRDAVVLTGKFAVLDGVPDGVLYRLLDAVESR